MINEFKFPEEFSMGPASETLGFNTGGSSGDWINTYLGVPAAEVELGSWDDAGEGWMPKNEATSFRIASQSWKWIADTYRKVGNQVHIEPLGYSKISANYTDEEAEEKLQEMRDLFSYAQIRAVNEDTKAPRHLQGTIPVFQYHLYASCGLRSYRCNSIFFRNDVTSSIILEGSETSIKIEIIWCQFVERIDGKKKVEEVPPVLAALGCYMTETEAKGLIKASDARQNLTNTPPATSINRLQSLDECADGHTEAGRVRSINSATRPGKRSRGTTRSIKPCSSRNSER